MKRLLLICIVVVIALNAIALFGCNSANEDKSAALPTAQSVPVQTPLVTQTPEPLPTPSLEPLEVPVYNDLDELLLTLDQLPVVDNYCSGSLFLKLEYLLGLTPDAAQRQKGDYSGYVIYETENGYRLYVFYNRIYSDSSRIYLVGFPVLVNELHSYSEFSGLSIGDPIDKAAEIDPLAGRLKEKLTERGSTAEWFHSRIEWGTPVAGIHYLSDGILLIEYDMNDDGVIYIINMDYSEDYTLVSKSTTGEIHDYLIDYYIFPIDLPPQ